MPTQTLLAEVRELRSFELGAREAFVNAVEQAHEAGFNNCQIALSAGMTEGGIRALLKRYRKK